MRISYETSRKLSRKRWRRLRPRVLAQQSDGAHRRYPLHVAPGRSGPAGGLHQHKHPTVEAEFARTKAFQPINVRNSVCISEGDQFHLDFIPTIFVAAAISQAKGALSSNVV